MDPTALSLIKKAKNIIRKAKARKPERQGKCENAKIPKLVDVRSTEALNCASVIVAYYKHHQYLTSIFPLNVWKIILGKLKIEKHQKLAAKYSPVFRKILEEERQERRERERLFWLFKQVFPLIMDKLGFKITLELRLVCKGWKAGVDSHLESIPSQLFVRQPDLNQGNRAVVLPNLYFPLQSQEQVNECLQKVESFKNTSGKSEMKINPFVGKCVVLSTLLIENRPETEIKVFLESVKVLFEKYGRYVFNLEIDWTRGPLEFYQVFENILQSTPNLRFLKLSGIISVLNLPEEWLFKLEQMIANNCLLPLPNLECLYFELNRLPVCIMRQISSMYFRQLKTLSVPNFDWKCAVNRGMPKLEQIEIRNALCEQTIQSEIPGLLPAPCLTWMTIDLKPDNQNNLLEMGTLIESVAKFPALKTLEILVSHLFAVNEPQVSVITEAEIETYKSKTIVNVRIVTCRNFRYDFLLCFPNLKNLHLQMTTKDWPKFPELPSFAKKKKNVDRLDLKKHLYSICTYHIQKCNIWTLLPRLKIFQFDLRKKENDAVLYKRCVTRK